MRRGKGILLLTTPCGSMLQPKDTSTDRDMIITSLSSSSFFADTASWKMGITDLKQAKIAWTI